MKGLCESAECCPTARNANARQKWLTRVRAPDRHAFRELVERLQSKVFSVCYALLGDALEADDAAQKVFVTIYRKVPYVTRESDDLRWIYQQAVKRCLHVLRTRRLQKCFAWLTERSSRPTVAELPGSSVNSQRVFLLRALAVVPDKERALLVLREIAAQPVEGIAEIMHMDSATVRRKLVGARRRLLTSMSAVAEKQGA